MGAPRITPEEIIEMQRLYRQLGTYTAVANEIGAQPVLRVKVCSDERGSHKYTYCSRKLVAKEVR